jgi:hypothetical protein
MATKPRNQGESGYFRIGDVVLDIPPETIISNKVVNIEELTPIRAPFPYFCKTGHSRWDVTIQWKAIIDQAPDGTLDYTQWGHVRRILAMVKASPFVEVENGHLRQLLGDDASVISSSRRMAFALQQLRVDFNPDLIDCLDCTLTMSLFNYRPFTPDFAYIGEQLEPASATQSKFFTTYLNNWITTNLNNPYSGADIDFTPFWEGQIDGTLYIQWREYVALPLTPQATGDEAIVQPLGKWKRPGAGPGDTESNYPGRLFGPEIINRGETNKLNALQAAMIRYESGGDITAVSETNHVGLMQWGQPQAIDTLKQMGGQYWQAALQSGLLVQPRTGGYKWAGPNQQASFEAFMFGPQSESGLTNQQQTDMQNQMASTWLDMKLQQSGRDADQALYHHLGAYEYFNPGNANYYTENNGANQPAATQWWKKVVGSYRNAIQNPNAFFYQAPDQNVDTSAIQSVPPSPPTPVSTPPQQPTQTNDNISGLAAPTSDEMAAVSSMIAMGWKPDHYTDVQDFLYTIHTMKLVDQEHRDFEQKDQKTGEFIDWGLWTTGFSVVFSNNLAQMPLQDDTYPTYQHLGPTTTMVSINLISRGEMETDESEPRHKGIAWITNALSVIDSQYHKIHSLWRDAGSFHRLQGVVLKNKVLNMLGIRGVIIENFTTQTVKESPNILQANLSAYQYENVYTPILAYRVQGIGTLEFDLWQDLLTGSENGKPDSNQQAFNAFRKGLTGNQADQYKNLFNLQDTLNNPTSDSSENSLLDYLTEGRGYLDNLTTRSVPMPNGVITNSLWIQNSSVTDPSIVWETYPALVDDYPAISEQIKNKVSDPGTTQSPTFTYADYFVWTRYCNPTIPGEGEAFSASFEQIVNQIDQLIATQASNQGVEQPLNRLYDLFLAWKMQTDPQIQQAMQNIEKTPGPLYNIFKNSINTGGPGREKFNAQHGAYTDMGLATISLAGLDNGPAYYFYDHSGQMRRDAIKQIDSAVTEAATAEAAINKTFKLPGAITNTPSIPITETSQAIKDRARLAANMSAPLFGSMSRAFPAFKLFLVEESNESTFYMFDNFGSYANVLDMEIIRYRDRPDTAVVTITNQSHLLTHRLFDNTVAGRQELADNIQLVNLPTSGNTQAPPGAEAGALINKTPNAFLQQINLTDSLPKNDFQDKASPNWFAVQTGAKMQIRMGFTNNPDELTPVFSGFITDIQGDEVLTVTAQGFMMELMTPSSDPKLIRDLVSYKGDVWGVMDACLKTPNAKHFGHWQMGTLPNPLLKGFQWSEVGGAVFSAITIGHIKNLFQIMQKASYDRRNENIRIDRLVNVNGSSDNQVVRPWWYEGRAYGAPKYTVSKDPSITPWTVMSDIARRYPEYILAVKQYGFPYEVNATLVFLDPNEWYFSRPTLPGDNETLRASNVNQTLFYNWWNTNGKAKVQAMFGVNKNVNKTTHWYMPSGAYQLSANFSYDVAAMVFGYGAFFFGSDNAIVAATPILQAAGIITNRIWGDPGNLLVDWITKGGGSSFDVVMDACTTITQSGALKGYESLGRIVTPGVNYSEEFSATITEIRQDLMTWIKTSNPDFSIALTDWMKPVRRYWYADRSVILNNAITKNDDVFNTIQFLDEDPICVNATIPDQYRNILVIDKMCIEPAKNIGQQNRHIKSAYAQSFLKEEMGKMYRGELVLLGSPEIEPFDVITISDDWMGMHGPIEVDSVIHSFSQETGYITIVKPRALVATNDRVTAPCWVAISDTWDGISYDTGYQQSFSSAAAAARAGEPGKAASIAIQNTPASMATATIGALATIKWIFNSSIITGEVENLNPIIICPIERFGRPWVAGLQGFEITNLMGVCKDRAVRFYRAELYPFIESWREAAKIALATTS